MSRDHKTIIPIPYINSALVPDGQSSAAPTDSRTIITATGLDRIQLWRWNAVNSFTILSLLDVPGTSDVLSDRTQSGMGLIRGHRYLASETCYNPINGSRRPFPFCSWVIRGLSLANQKHSRLTLAPTRNDRPIRRATNGLFCLVGPPSQRWPSPLFNYDFNLISRSIISNLPFQVQVTAIMRERESKRVWIRVGIN